MAGAKPRRNSPSRHVRMMRNQEPIRKYWLSLNSIARCYRQRRHSIASRAFHAGPFRRHLLRTGGRPDGLLTASEVAGLKLDADWVVMSACNTASGTEPGAEALSGLAKAFFYAGARALLVSHWPVNSYAATTLTSRTFEEMRRDDTIGRSEAFRRAMLLLLSDTSLPWAAHPSVWAPFVVVGEGGAEAPR